MIITLAWRTACAIARYIRTLAALPPRVRQRRAAMAWRPRADAFFYAACCVRTLAARAAGVGVFRAAPTRCLHRLFGDARC